jgi:hypothetical protein
VTKTEIDKIIEAIQLGVDMEIAVHAVGASMSEVFHWLERGKTEEAKIAAEMGATKTEAKYLNFWKAVRKARASSIAAVQMNIRNATIDDWKAAAWWLEKTMPEKYSKNAERLTQISEQMKELENNE